MIKLRHTADTIEIATRKVRKIRVWMKNYGHSTPKPTVLFGNTASIEGLMTGKLCKATPTTVRTTQKYVDSSGKARWKGTSAPKGTQPLASVKTR